ncbi:MAG: hypothetical protein Q9157_001005 [Trypethelium eluteriae]
MRRLRQLVAAGLGGVAGGVAVDAVAGVGGMLGPLLPEGDGGFEDGLGGLNVEAGGTGVEGRVAGGAGLDGGAFRRAVRAGGAGLAGVALELVLRFVGAEDGRRPGLRRDAGERVAWVGGGCSGGGEGAAGLGLDDLVRVAAVSVGH